MRFLRYVLVAGLVAALAGTLTVTAGSMATIVAAPVRATHLTGRRPPAGLITEARNALARYLRHYRPQMQLAHPVRPQAGPDGTTAAVSYNWSGYADTTTKKGTFTAVSGSWTTPKVTCNAEDEISSDWVGLDGAQASDPTYEQEGTVGWCYKGSPVYFTWYDMYPGGTKEVGTSLAPGDKIAASVSRSGSSYKLQLTDSTHPGNSFSVTKTCATSSCLDESAEWIAERPSFSIGTAPQAKYNAFKLTSGAETANGKTGTIGSFATGESITMVDATDAYNLNDVSSLTGGNSFSTTWKNSY